MGYFKALVWYVVSNRNSFCDIVMAREQSSLKQYAILGYPLGKESKISYILGSNI